MGCGCLSGRKACVLLLILDLQREKSRPCTALQPWGWGAVGVTGGAELWEGEQLGGLPAGGPAGARVECPRGACEPGEGPPETSHGGGLAWGVGRRFHLWV